MIHKIKMLQSSGLSERAISKTIGIHRDTVKKYMNLSEEDISKIKRDVNRNKKLDEYRDLMVFYLKKYPKMSAPKMQSKISSKFDDFFAPDRSMRRYVSKLKKSINEKQKRYYEPILDMVPGMQCQIDAGELRGMMIGGKPTTMYFLVFVLSYSRMMHVSATIKPINTEIFIRMHDAAFRYFEGMPEECVYDQTKLVVIEEEAREVVVNSRFNEYATTAGFDIHACRGYDPESKGKVEAGVKYVKGNCFYGEEFLTESAMHDFLSSWVEKANKRNHGTTKKVPYEMWQEEQPKLRPYLVPKSWHPSRPSIIRKADKTSLISWKGNKYSIPDDYQDSNVSVEESNNMLFVYDIENNSEIVAIELSALKGEIFKNPQHYRRSLISDIKYEDELKSLIGGSSIKICELLKSSNPKFYRAQLKGFIALVRRNDELDGALLNILCESQKLTVRSARELIEAYAIAERPTSNDDMLEASTLSHYAALKIDNQG